MKKTEWFSTWFDSPYYHILYKNRDYDEAALFLNNLIDYLKPKKDSLMLDLACGSGRHTNFLAGKGFNVVGVDLSVNSILEAQKKQLNNSRFFVMDMREKIDFIKFDYVFNLFTSFGYFETEDENYKVIEAVKHCLNKEGIYIIDFFNCDKVKKNLVKNEVKNVDGIAFYIERTIRNNVVIKRISFEDKNQNYTFIERVNLFSRLDFETFLKKAGFEVLGFFGDYELNNHDEKDSDRLITIAKLKG